ncbi:MAG: CarD family transcriptional regulator [Lachnotalea sp.]
MIKKLYNDKKLASSDEVVEVSEVYTIGEKVMHPTEGACYIKGTTTMQQASEKREYYTLVPMLNEKTIIYVPVLNNSANRIRKIMSVSEIDEIGNEIKDEDFNWIPDNRKRQEIFTVAIKSCDTVKIAKIIIMMLQRELEKPLQSLDKELLCRAQKLAYSEIALVKGKSFEEVTRDIKSKVQF